MKRLIFCAIALLAGCGGGGDGAEEELPPPPDLAIFFVSGHTGIFDGEPSESYLHESAGPDILVALSDAGYTFEYGNYVDDAYNVGGFGGFQAMLADMTYVRDELVPRGTRVLVIAHSHGGVWAHGAISLFPEMTITCAVDLDTSSYGWAATGHDSQNSFLGGDPRNRYTSDVLVSYPQYPNAPSDSSGFYDLEDMVFLNTRFALEVRSGEFAPGGDELYDEKWNIRIDDTTDGLYGYYSDTSHSEVHQAGSATMTVVKAWLLERLGE